MLELLHDAAHQRTLTLAVLPDEGDLVSALDHQVDPREDALVLEGLAYALHLYGVGARARGWWEAETDRGAVYLVDLDEL